MPSAVQDVDRCMKELESHGWTQNYYGRMTAAYDEELEECTADELIHHCNPASREETRAKYRQLQKDMGKMRKRMRLLFKKMIKDNRNQRHPRSTASDMYLGSTKSGHIAAYGEKAAFECFNALRLFSCDISFKFTFMTGMSDIT